MTANSPFFEFLELPKSPARRPTRGTFFYWILPAREDFGNPPDRKQTLSSDRLEENAVGRDAIREDFEVRNEVPVHELDRPLS